MYKIGITGSIGTGKTTIAKMFSLLNIPIFDADKEIKKIFKYQKVKKEIIDNWPKIIKNNKIDKLKLKSIIFSNKNEKKKLETILYPYLEVRKNKFENDNANNHVLVYDVPLIYETKSNKNYDLILLANCDANIQKKRVLNRDQISETLFEKIVNSQLSFKEKIKFKPKIINTNNYKIFILLKVVLIFTKIILRQKIKKWI